MNITYERFDNVLKVTLSDYEEGENFFYCDLDILDILEEASSIYFYNYKEGQSRYVKVDEEPLHRLIALKDGKNIDGLYVDHISGVTFDNRRCNLRAVKSFENLANNPNYGVHISDLKKFEVSCSYKVLNYSCNANFELEQDALRCRASIDFTLRSVYHTVTYEFLKDRRNDSDLVCQLCEGEISKEDELNLYLDRYKDNPWYFYRYYYELKDYSNLFNLSGVDNNERGYLIDKETGEILCPYIDYINAVKELSDLQLTLQEIHEMNKRIDEETEQYNKKSADLDALKLQLDDREKNLERRNLDIEADDKAVEFLLKVGKKDRDIMYEEYSDYYTMLFLKQELMYLTEHYLTKVTDSVIHNSLDFRYNEYRSIYRAFDSIMELAVTFKDKIEDFSKYKEIIEELNNLEFKYRD